MTCWQAGTESARRLRVSASNSQASLMDDVEFLAELEKFDSPAPVADTARTEPRALRALTWAERPTFKDEETPRPARASAAAPNSRVLAVAGFILMMCVGGAAAALVFYDRVAQILAQWF